MRAVLRTSMVMGVLAMAAVAGAETRYHIVYLGLGEARAINNSGQIVGNYNYSGAAQPCIFYASGDELMLLGGLDPNVPQGSALDINDTGEIVGWAYNVNGYQRAVSFDPTGGGANVDLGTLGGDWSVARAINNAGQIVGDAQSTEPPYYSNHATSFDPTGGGFNVALSAGEQSGGANGINDRGLVVGQYAQDAVSVSGPALWDLSDGSVHDLEVFVSNPSCFNGYGVAINESDQILGILRCYEQGYWIGRPTTWETPVSTPVFIGQRYEEVLGLNDHGVGVGVGGHGDGSPESWASKFEQVGGGWAEKKLQDHCLPGHWLTLTAAHDINNDGWIVGSGYAHPNGGAFLLKPITPGDLDYDCDVDFDDLNILLAGYGMTSGATYDDGDIDEDGDVDFDDLNLLLAVYGQVCP